MSELQIVKRDGTLYKTSVSRLARQITIELEKEGEGHVNRRTPLGTKMINAVFDAVETLMENNNDGI
jgi:hypothetical protein